MWKRKLVTQQLFTRQKPEQQPGIKNLKIKSLKNTKIHFTKNKLFHKYFSGIELFHSKVEVILNRR